jgi:alpha-glucosidase (family GH31 glycosyl hydrolase)
MTKNVIKNYKKTRIPLGTIWNDIDYMKKCKNFILNLVRFPLVELRPFVDELHASHQQYVTIIDIGKFYFNDFFLT